MEILTEGIKHFKGSKVANFYASVFCDRLIKLKSKAEHNEKTKVIFDDLYKLSSDFLNLKVTLQNLEREYKKQSNKKIKKELKEEYKEVMEDNKYLFKRASKIYSKMKHTKLKAVMGSLFTVWAMSFLKLMADTQEMMNSLDIEGEAEIPDSALTEPLFKDKFSDFNVWNTSVKTEGYFNY